MTNIVLNVLVLVALTVVSWPVLRRMRGWPLLWATVHLCVLTAVFDTIMIDVGLYVFDPAKILGVHVWGAPLEDFAYAIAAAVFVPVLWRVLGRSPRTASRPDGTHDTESAHG
ncbi:lycopene cyclase domain-containing protein [Cellulomonas wangsupingiae]|uniref:Lycopene cyclase domain-containing protein n=1 Tax=Cellulomonas wangsupingiae TaxID=2968085 RepID=A0ABY5K1X3_9CELL|nr:lycopene cyclase domain-containing protein [Cellulomonas wangsupingiae]MCC2335395.1 lycopene cyclase domain-containing protein [Cellulomonas wangsupingiae]MCM0640073.1 lycopene cyclase domain-containing protein [Cellulomonas wangsupingiae]UUI64429.1 lycopene cyclase domain-containing protein [Cellulomonas wangsupingiae]